MGRLSFAVHRWLGAIIGLQLLVWSLGGFIFATHSLSWVRGQDRRANHAPPVIALDGVALTPSQAARAAKIEPVEIVLRTLGNRPVYEVRGTEGSALVDPSSGEVLSPVPRALAERIAVGDRLGEPGVESAILLSEAPPTEYRDGELPAWRVALDDGEDTNIYVSASTGAITARRNNAWRRFDFFWMLHTMDYQGRDNFNHPLLIGASALAIASVLSGFLLWALRVRRRVRRRARSP